MKPEFSPDIQQYINRQLDAGVFHDQSELLTAAVKRMMDDERQGGWTLEALRAAVAVGADEADRGEVVEQSMEEIFAEWKRERTSKN